MNWYLTVLKEHYADFKGRARRKEYWMFVLFNIIVSVVIAVIASVIGLKFLSSLYSLAVLVPCLALTARRLHDIGKSGWWMLIALVPLIGSIWLLVLLVLDSQPETNAWGANPKA